MRSRNNSNKKPFHLLVIGLFCFFSTNSLGLIAQESFDLSTVKQELEYQLKELREENLLPALSPSEKLNAVAFDQAEYVAEKGRVVHEQEKEQKQTVTDRIIYFEAFNAEVGENISMIAPRSRVQVSKGGEKVVIQNEELLVKAAIHSWMKEEDSKLNLLDSNFYEIGLGIHESERKDVVIVAVLATLPYELPSDVKQKFNFRGIESYNKEKCKVYEEKFNTSPELFSDAFSIEGNELYFSYHNKELIESLLEESSDGISAEIICDWQFECNVSNRLFPGDITDGYLMPILKKGGVSNLNLAEDENALKVKIGEIPTAFTSQSFEVNGMIIKDNAKCASIPYNKIEVKNLRWLDLPFQKVKLKNDSSLSWSDSLHMLFYAKHVSVLDSEIVENSKLIHQLGFEIESIDIEVSLSPAEDPEIFDGFEYELLRALKLDSSKLGPNNFSKKVNWPAYEAFQTNTFYELETRGMNQEAKIEYLKETRKTDPKLNNFLDSLSYMKVLVSGKVNLEQKLSVQQQIDLFRFALKQEKSELSLYIYNQLLENKDLTKQDLIKISADLGQNKEQLSLINNLIVELSERGETTYDGNALTTSFLELHLVDKSNGMVRYNYLISRMHDWADRKYKISSTKEWESSMNRIKSQLDNQLFARSMLNYQMLMADHYYDQGKTDLREKSFKSLVNWIPKAGLDSEMIYSISQYLAFQDQSNRAVKVLLPEVKKDDAPAKHLFYFLQLAIYDSEDVSDAFYVRSMEKASTLYPKEFCELFSKKKMGLQVLKDYEVKSLYCESCQK